MGLYRFHHCHFQFKFGLCLWPARWGLGVVLGARCMFRKCRDTLPLSSWNFVAFGALQMQGLKTRTDISESLCADTKKLYHSVGLDSCLFVYEDAMNMFLCFLHMIRYEYGMTSRIFLQWNVICRRSLTFFEIEKFLPTTEVSIDLLFARLVRLQNAELLEFA